jgi:hypothetical protein
MINNESFIGRSSSDSLLEAVGITVLIRNTGYFNALYIAFITSQTAELICLIITYLSSTFWLMWLEGINPVLLHLEIFKVVLVLPSLFAFVSCIYIVLSHFPFD